LAIRPERTKLAAQLRHLPIHVVTEPLCSELLGKLFDRCDGYLDLREREHIDPILFNATIKAMPAVVAWRELEREARQSAGIHGSEESGSPSVSFGPIEYATTAIGDVMSDPDEASKSATRLAEPIRNAPDDSLAAARWTAELERLMRLKDDS